MYIGNIDTKTKLISWIKDFFYSRQKTTPTYAVLYGHPGNGKTFLVEHLAQTLHLNIHKLTPEDDINSFLQTINICKLDDLTTRKLILIDDINDFTTKQIFNITISRYPIIYTSPTYPPEDLRHGLTLKIQKPTTTQLFDLLKSKQKELNINHPDSKLLQLSIESPSVRSAINSLYTGIPQQSTYTDTDILTIRKALTNRQLTQDIDIPMLHGIIKNANIYKEPTIIEQLAHYDFSLKVKFTKSIDSFLINNMLPPIETLKWFTKKAPFKQTKKEPINQKTLPPKPTQHSIDSFL